VSAVVSAASGMVDEVSIKSSGKSANLLNLSGISEIIPYFAQQLLQSDYTVKSSRARDGMFPFYPSFLKDFSNLSRQTQGRQS
jgi:hypothetical protein